MKENITPILAVVAAVFAVSCSNNDIEDMQPSLSCQTNITTSQITASVQEDNATPQTGTKMGMAKNDDDTSVSFYWHKGDAIAVQTVDNGNYAVTEFSTANETPSTTAQFTTAQGEVTLGKYAAYPYNAVRSFTETALTYHLPAEYTVANIGGNVFTTTTNYPVPMLAKLTGNDAAFKHIGGLAIIRIDQMPVESGTITITANQQISGDFVCDMTADELVIKTVESTSTTTVADADKKVTIAFSNAKQGETGVFCLPMPTGSYSGTTISLASAGNTTQTINYGHFYVGRATVNIMKLYNIDGTVDKFSSQTSEGTYTINGHTFVDMGLSSGLLWATANLGADKETAYGSYYAWGNLQGATTTTDVINSQDRFYVSPPSSSSYYTKYTTEDGKKTLDAEDDASTVNWGFSCRMPTADEFAELKNSANWTWTAKDGVNGYLVTSKNNGNSIYLPASGGLNSVAFYNEGTCGYYWTSTFGSMGNSMGVYSYLEKSQYGSYNEALRLTFYAIRPVAEAISK